MKVKRKGGNKIDAPTPTQVAIKIQNKPIWINIRPCIGGIKNGSLYTSANQYVIYYGFQKPRTRFSNMNMHMIETPSGQIKIFRSLNTSLEFARNYFLKYKVKRRR